ncbi:MAG: tRNA (adenosine(37)-N6)-threonylcarbamoyltransferase complex transferase subunit TsaD [Phycisphaerales bacterium]|nr:tRNA (adenosine(37)-N6)-threonylcarbamoyltransferase complex transferase subunit TsaD [Phycisphaerales bacterium]
MTAPRDGTLVLGIETSCDETAAAVVQWRDGVPRVRSNVVSSQHDLHERYAGVVPELASRAHLERIVPVVREALGSASVDAGALNAVAVGNRPGLIGSLLVGNAAAKAYAWSLGIPVLGIDHVAAHLAAGLIDAPPPAWPALGLVASGGHTHLFRMHDPLHAELLGRTIDDAVGEAFDKAATILDLGYPGGPRLDARSSEGNAGAVRFPLPRLTARSVRGAAADAAGAADPDARTLDFSFSGLKTALLYAVRGVPPSPGRTPPPAPEPLTPQRVSDLCASFQAAAVAQVVDVVARAHARLAASGQVPRTLLVGGGASANRHMRAELASLGERLGMEVRLPALAYCLDNAAMIAALAHWRLAAGERDDLRLAPSARSALGRT